MLLSLRGMHLQYPKFIRVYIILTIRVNMRHSSNEQNRSCQNEQHRGGIIFLSSRGKVSIPFYVCNLCRFFLSVNKLSFITSDI